MTTAQNAVFTYFKAKLSPIGVTPVQYAILKCLWDNPNGLSPSQISQMLFLDASTITGILTRMDNKGLIERFFCTEDRRTVRVVITKAALALRPEIETAIIEANTEVLADLSENERKTLKELLRKITDAQKAPSV